MNELDVWGEVRGHRGSHAPVPRLLTMKGFCYFVQVRRTSHDLLPDRP